MKAEERAELQKRKITVGTPMYGGKCHGAYTMGCTELTAACVANGIPITFEYLYNSSHISAARNLITRNFLETDFTHLIFIDADTRFKAADVLNLALFDEDIVAGPVPLKHPNGKEEYNFQLESDESLDINRLLDVKRVGAAFVMIKREVFDKYREFYPEYDTSHDYFSYFDTRIRESDKVFLGEDVFFIENCLKMGTKVKICPWLKLGHIGESTWEGDLSKIQNKS